MVDPTPLRKLSPNDGHLFRGKIPCNDKRVCQPRVIHFVHIPKTAGESLMRDAQQYMPIQVALIGNKEAAYSATSGKPEDMITFLREPISHVLSQFIMCKYSDWGKEVGGLNFPGRPQMDSVMAGFDQWVQHFVSQPHVYTGQRHGFGCYTPWNQQSRHLTSNKLVGPPHWVFQESDRIPDVDLARRNLQAIGILGIVEYYGASLCLLEFHANHGHLTPNCQVCSNQTKTSLSQRQTHYAHGTPPHNISDIQPDTLESVRLLTEIDQQVYAYALDLFRREIDHVLNVTGVDLLCRGTNHSDPQNSLYPENFRAQNKVILQEADRLGETIQEGYHEVVPVLVLALLAIRALWNWTRTSSSEAIDAPIESSTDPPQKSLRVKVGQ